MCVFQNILCSGLPNLVLMRTKDTIISKHPMLRFTDNASPFELQALSFQNILCYGLPSSQVNIPIGFLSFQNILCYGLPVCHFLKSARFRISKHPMLRFTCGIFFHYLHARFDFKTSYVTVYLFAGVGGIDLGLFQNILCYGLPR